MQQQRTAWQELQMLSYSIIMYPLCNPVASHGMYLDLFFQSAEEVLWTWENEWTLIVEQVFCAIIHSYSMNLSNLESKQTGVNKIHNQQ